MEAKPKGTNPSGFDVGIILFSGLSLQRKPHFKNCALSSSFKWCIVRKVIFQGFTFYQFHDISLKWRESVSENVKTRQYG